MRYWVTWATNTGEVKQVTPATEADARVEYDKVFKFTGSRAARLCWQRPGGTIHVAAEWGVRHFNLPMPTL